jgi:hypothetical protein
MTETPGDREFAEAFMWTIGLFGNRGRAGVEILVRVLTQARSEGHATDGIVPPSAPTVATDES